MTEQINPLKIGPNGVELLNMAFSEPVKDDEEELRAAAEQQDVDLDEIHVPSFEEIEAELQEFEALQRQELGIEEEILDHWIDENPQQWTESQRPHTTMLIGGLTMAQDQFAAAAFRGLGYKVVNLDVPDQDALRVGKEFGNRAQCNPTYFTVGNLVKHLQQLRDEEGMSSEEIVEKYVFLTAGACGPCRFGTYTTEYRKALRDAGFDGFRVMLFQQQGGLKQATGDMEKPGLDLSPQFFIGLLKGLVAGDVLNAIGYRIRPYEVNEGDTDRAIEECKKYIIKALQSRKSVLWALLKSRRILSRVKVDRLQPKPKVSIIGEFWAMTTEGAGNHKLQRFLESEGAEVDIQLVTAWVLYNIWEHQFDTRRRMKLRGKDGGPFGLQETEPMRKLALLWVAERALRLIFQTFAHAIGLSGYHLPDMNELAEVAHQYYPNELRGGEGHMEVAKLILSEKKKKAHMVLSVKPFGCMPSSGVSDGVQSLVTKQYPNAIFCPIETNGDGEVNLQSRVQMFLFKARKRAREEYQELLGNKAVSEEAVRRQMKKRHQKAIHYPKHVVAGTAANAVMEA